MNLSFLQRALRCIATNLCYPATLQRGAIGLEIMASGSIVDVVLDSVADGVFTVDPDLQITYWNRAAEEITGYSAVEAVGRPCHEVFRATLCGEECPMRQAITTGGASGPADVEILTREGAELTVSVSAAALRDRDGSFLGGVESFRDIRARRPTRDPADESLEVAGIVSRSESMRRVLGILPAVARSDAAVLIRGPSGAGKELVARAIHRLSQRNAAAFLKLSGGTISDALGDDEPLGRRADGGSGLPFWIDEVAAGTLFLDEIGDLLPPAQTRLLHILEQEAFQPARASEDPGAHTRVIASTRHDLERDVREGRFREDLYYRLGVITIDVPSLTERKSDIPLLVERCLERLSRRGERIVNRVSPETMRILQAHDYPGNIRELENLMEHAFVVGQGSVLEPEHLPSYILRGSVSNRGGVRVERSPDRERETLLAVLHKHGRNRTLAAMELGIHRSTLWRRMRKFGFTEEPHGSGNRKARSDLARSKEP